jgi:hypothetical protein
MSDVPVYQRVDVPPHLLTNQQLRNRGHAEGERRPDAYVLVELFDSRDLVVSQRCVPDGEHARDRRQAARWAQEVLDDPEVVLLDTECTDFEGRIIEIALVRPSGEVLLETLVDPEGEPIAADAGAKHGITDAMVAADDVPTFAELHAELVDLLTGAHVVCWNADFDHARLTAEADRLLPSYSTAAATEWVQARWDDAMLQHAAWVGEPSLHGDGYKRHRLDGEHRALGDCFAMLSWLREMAANPEPPVPARTSGSWSDADRVELEDLHREGLDFAAIAVHTGRTEKAVRWHLHNLGLEPFPSDLVQAAAPAIPKPPPAYTVADLRATHANSHKRWTAEEEEQLTRRHREGASIERLVAEFGRNEGGITARLQRLGLIDAGPDAAPPF